jgi:hypothetical protein
MGDNHSARGDVIGVILFLSAWMHRSIVRLPAPPYAKLRDHPDTISHLLIQPVLQQSAELPVGFFGECIIQRCNCNVYRKENFRQASNFIQLPR